LPLQIEEVLARLELRIGLGDGEKPAERLVEDALRLTRRRRSLSLLRSHARLRDRLERAALVRGVPLDRLHEIGNQVMAPLELHLDLRPGVVDTVTRPDEPVVDPDHPEDEQEDDSHQHEDDPEHCSSLRGREGGPQLGLPVRGIVTAGRPDTLHVMPGRHRVRRLGLIVALVLVALTGPSGAATRAADGFEHASLSVSYASVEAGSLLAVSLNLAGDGAIASGPPSVAAHVDLTVPA